MSARLVRFGLAALAILVLWFAVANWLDDLTAWLPWSDESRLARSEQARAHAESDADARGLEAEGEREQAGRIDTFHRQVIEVHTITAEAVSQARSATDANEPLPLDRAARLRSHDDGLCNVSPALCGPASAEPAGGSGDAM